MAKATTAKAPKKAKKKKSKTDAKGIDLLWKLADHPLVGELIAVGAAAAVAAIAEQSIARKGKDKKDASSKAAVKAAGSAAAAAIGQRLFTEFTEVKKASKKASA